MRLDKFVAHTSAHSRSDVRRLLRDKRVCVNGQPVRDAGLALTAADLVTLDGNALTLTGPRYFMLHKPAGVVSATEDSEHRTVLDLLQTEGREGLHVAGRLDIDTTGLVLITDDGQWSHRIKAPGRHEKRYRVQTARPIEADAVTRFAAGLSLRGEEDTPTRPARLEITGACEALVWLQEGRYHQVKRMFAAIGNHVDALHREAVAGIELDPALAPGAWRALTAEEIASGQLTDLPQ
ncbi:MAG: pseudouridine synthase [bacterium]|nr:pseudouridine synthase [bacterium]